LQSAKKSDKEAFEHNI
jgi:hypothetical protein